MTNVFKESDYNSNDGIIVKTLGVLLYGIVYIQCLLIIQ